MEIKELDLHITNKCNLHCRHCVFSSGERIIPEIKQNKIFQLIDDFSILTHRQGCINIFGGEALLRDDIFEIIIKVKSAGLNIGFTTNCHVPGDALEKLFRLGINRFTSDLDGSDAREHEWLRNMDGNFEKVIRTLRRSVEENIYTTVNSVLYKGNLHQVINILELCENIGINGLAFYFLTPTGRGRHIINQVIGPKEWLNTKRAVSQWVTEHSPRFSVIWEEAYELTSNLNKNVWRCMNDHTDTLFIRCDGEVYSCALLENAPCSLGNINIDSIEIILMRRKNKAFTCHKGCPALAFHSTGDLFGSDPREQTQYIKLGCPYNYLMLY